MILFKATAALCTAALLTGLLHADNARWRQVATELHQAHPQLVLRHQLSDLMARIQRPKPIRVGA